MAKKSNRKQISLFGYCYPVKPAKKLIHMNEVFDEDRLLDILPDGHLWKVSYKANGIRCFLHKKDGKVKLFSDSGREIEPKKVEPIILEAKKMYPDNIILDGELMLYNHGHPLGHQGVVSFLRSKGPVPEVFKIGIRYKVWDCIYHDGDITGKPYKERFDVLLSIHHKTPHIHLVNNLDVPEKKVKDSILRVRSREGAIVRALDSKYFDENLLFKVKKTYQVDCKVIKIERAKNGSYIYTCVDSDNDILGKTYGQKLVKVKLGDVIAVNITELSRTKKGNKYVYHWYSPMVVVAKKNHLYNSNNRVDSKKVLDEIYLAMHKKRGDI